MHINRRPSLALEEDFFNGSIVGAVKKMRFAMADEKEQDLTNLLRQVDPHRGHAVLHPREQRRHHQLEQGETVVRNYLYYPKKAVKKRQQRAKAVYGSSVRSRLRIHPNQAALRVGSACSSQRPNSSKKRGVLSTAFPHLARPRSMRQTL